MSAGLHAGTSAIGNYGLMPITVKNVIKGLRRRRMSNPELNALFYAENDSIAKRIEKNRNLEEFLAKELAIQLYNKHEGDERKMAYAWLMGSSINNIPEHKLNNHYYVKRYLNVR